VSKVEDSLTRLKALKRLIRRLPDVNYATLQFVCRHLTKVISKSDVNKMEVKNLAIVFGPTLVRTSDDNMMSMITDMGQQCRIIESILSNCDWFFSQDANQLQVRNDFTKMALMWPQDFRFHNLLVSSSSSNKANYNLTKP